MDVLVCTLIPVVCREELRVIEPVLFRSNNNKHELDTTPARYAQCHDLRQPEFSRTGAIANDHRLCQDGYFRMSEG